MTITNKETALQRVAGNLAGTKTETNCQTDSVFSGDS